MLTGALGSIDLGVAGLLVWTGGDFLGVMVDRNEDEVVEGSSLEDGDKHRTQSYINL